MIWIVLGLGLLCIAMLCVSLWYRTQWDKSLDRECDLSEKYEEMRDSRDGHKYESERLLTSIGNLNIEVDATKEKLQKSEDMSQRRLKAYDECRKDRDRLQEELRQLRESLPKRDSKGRFCKK